MEQEESKVPVFTVLKKGAILKNIFIINKPPSSFPGVKSMTTGENDENPDREDEEIFIVGRHPDCHIVLLHPSISRFHLQINCKPSSQKLFVTDLSSVHGTWVSDIKIEGGQRVELNEDDTIRVGGSTRVYKLHWIPFSRAYDTENPFVSASDLKMIDEKDEESEEVEVENEVKSYQDETLRAAEMKHYEYNSLSVGVKEERDQDIMQSLESIVMDVASLYCNENGSILKKDIALSPISIIESVSFSYYDAREEVESLSIDDQEESEISSHRTFPGGDSETNAQDCNEDRQRSEYHSTKVVPEGVNSDSLFTAAETVSHSTPGVTEETDTLFLRRKDPKPVNLLLPIDVSETVFQQVSKEPHSPENSTGNQESGVLSSLFSECSVSETNSQECNEDRQISEYHSMKVVPDGVNSDSLFTATETVSYSTPGVTEETDTLILLRKDPEPVNLLFPIDVSETVFQQVNKEPHCPENSAGNQESGVLLSLFPECSEHVVSEVFEVKNQTSPRSNIGEVIPDITDSKESQTPQSVVNEIENAENIKSSGIMSEKKLNSLNIWSRRGKPATPLQLQTSRSRGETKENEVDSVVKALFHSSLEATEREFFTPDTENTPNSLLLKSTNDKTMVKEVLCSNSCRSLSSNITLSPSFLPVEDKITFTDKENLVPRFQQRKSARLTPKTQVKSEQEMVLMERRAERVPLQSLFVNSPGKSISGVSRFNPVETESRNTTFCSQAAKKISNGYEKRRWTMVADTTSLLDKKSRKSLQLLQGLKGTHLLIPKTVLRELDCLKRRGSLFRRTTQASLALEWIEESMEKEKWWIHVQSSLEDGRAIAPTPRISPNSQFSTCSNSLEIASPTAEDDILDYALSQRKMNKEGQLVLLTNDVTMTIKAMAEGLLCETAQEFRDSLVNPFSERFMWADSSPRGQTWSVCDDVLLKEKYYPSPSKKSSKGLKLILPHNSHYGQQHESRISMLQLS